MLECNFFCFIPLLVYKGGEGNGLNLTRNRVLPSEFKGKKNEP